MKLSINTAPVFNELGIAAGTEILAQAGFDAIDFNFRDIMHKERYSRRNIEKTCESIRKIAEANGLYYNQTHGSGSIMSFKEDIDLCDKENSLVREYIETSIIGSAILGAERVVLHPVNCPGSYDARPYNLEFFESFIPVLKEYGITAAIENVWTHNEDKSRIITIPCSMYEEQAEYCDALDSRYFTACLDIGHCFLLGRKPEDAVCYLGSRLSCLHVHDNDGISDRHTPPYSGGVNWDAVMTALADTGYKGDFTYEITGGYTAYLKSEHEIYPYALKLAEVTGRNLIRKFTTHTPCS